jgi:hypothetical protein
MLITCIINVFIIRVIFKINLFLNKLITVNVSIITNENILKINVV